MAALRDPPARCARGTPVAPLSVDEPTARRTVGVDDHGRAVDKTAPERGPAVEHLLLQLLAHVQERVIVIVMRALLGGCRKASAT